MTKHFKSAILCAVIAVAIGQSASVSGAVLPVDSASIDVSNGGGLVSQLTIGGITYDELTLPTTASADTTRTAWNFNGGSDPVDAATGLGNAIATDGLLNTNATFLFEKTIGVDQRIVFMELERATFDTFSEAVTFFPVDASGAKIGDLSLSLTDSVNGGSNQYGPALIPGNFELKVVDVANPLVDFNVKGVSFSLADMTGTTGDLGLARGFRVEDTFGGVGVDPSYAALAVPEPSGILLLSILASFAASLRRPTFRG